MKKIKILTSIVTLGMVSIPLTSCNKNDANTCTIQFRASDGISLSSTKSITVAKNITWQQLEAKSLIPTVTIPDDFTDLGWCVQNDDGEWESIPPGYSITSNITVKYFGYSNTEHPSINVHLKYAQSEFIDYDFAGGFTFKQFRSYHGLPEKPESEGIVFKGYYDITSGSTLMTDTYVFNNKNTNIEIKWEAVQYTASLLSSDGNIAAVSPNSVQFDHGEKWKNIKTKATITFSDPNKYELDKWVDENGNELTDEMTMTGDFKAYATFKEIPYYTIHLTKSDEVTFNDDPSTTEVSITVKTGTKWGDIPTGTGIGHKPKVSYDAATYTEIGWVTIDSEGNYEVIDDNYVVKTGLEAKFVVYNSQDYKKPVQFKLEPYSTAEYESLMYLQGGTFGGFRKLYNIPAEPHYEGYTFKGYYVVHGGDDPINDLYTFEDNVTPVSIEARYDEVTCDVMLSTNGYGTLSANTISVPYGTTWGDAVKKVVATPDFGYYLQEWVDKDGFTISSDYVIKDRLDAKAVFKAGKTTINLVASSLRSTYFGGDRHYKTDIKHTETQQGLTNPGFNQPTLNESNLLNFTSNGNSTDGRFVAQTIRIGIAVMPHTTKKTTLNIKGVFGGHVGHHTQEGEINMVLQVLKLENENDFPNFYAWPQDNNDKRSFDQKCIYHNAYHDSHYSLVGDWERTVNFDSDIVDFIDVNDTDDVKIYSHFIQVAFTHAGWGATWQPSQRSWVNLTLTLRDRE